MLPFSPSEKETRYNAKLKDTKTLMVTVSLDFLSKLHHLWSHGICCKTQEKNKCSSRHIPSVQYDASCTLRQPCVLEKETVSPDLECHKGSRQVKEFIGKGQITLSPLIQTQEEAVWWKEVTPQAMMCYKLPDMGGEFIKLNACTLINYVGSVVRCSVVHWEGGYFPPAGQSSVG